MRRLILPAIAFGLLGMIGCAKETESAPEARTGDPVATAAPAPNATGETGCRDDQPTPTAAKPVVVVAAKPNDTAVQIELIKYKQLGEAVRAHKGKIVVVDVWGTFCIPCMKEFPHLVELSKAHGKDVVCMSLSVDDPTPEKKAKALEFLTKQGATFQNFLLDEESEVWQKNWKVNGVPVVFVFDRDGNQAVKFDAEDPDKPFTYKDVKAKVEELLKK